MKRKDLLLLTLLLSQTVSTNAIAMWNEGDEETIRGAAHGQPRTNVQHVGFEPLLPPIVHTLTPSDPLPADLGTARQRVSCTFGNNPPVELILPTQHPLHGQWVFQEDRDNTQNLATLMLRALVNQQWREVFQREVEIQHELVSSDPEIPGWNYFNGDIVYQARTQLQRWRDLLTRQEYSRTLAIQDGDVLNHQGNQVVYVEPFAFGDDLLRTRDDYRGSYNFLRDLTDVEGLRAKKIENVIYSDGHRIFLPKISQELWRSGDGTTNAGFFIASYKQDRRLNFIDGAHIPNGHLPEGLYQLLSVQENPDRRIERWQKFGEEADLVEISVPSGLSSVVGIGASVSHVVPNGEAGAQVLQLREGIQAIHERRLETDAHHPDGSITLVGPAGVGKSTLVHGVAGTLRAEADSIGELFLSPAQPLPGFNVGHTVQVGTQIPASWYDSMHNVVYWDCPGFGDLRGPVNDILNAYAINALFRTNTKVALVVDYPRVMEVRPASFLGLLRDITEVFQDDHQLRQSLSLVVTKTDSGRAAPHRRIQQIYQQTQDPRSELAILNDYPRARALLEFLAQPEQEGRILSFVRPQVVGEEFDIRDQVLRLLAKSHYVAAPQTRIRVGADSQLLAATFAQGLNEYLTNYMRTEGSQRVISHCAKLINDHQGLVAQLRTNLGAVAATLQGLQGIGVPMQFADGLRNIMNIDDITTTIEHISFLRQIREGVEYRINDWANALLGTIGKIQLLSGAPQTHHADGVLTVRGTLVGTSDVHNALQDSEHARSRSVNLHGFNSLFIDRDLESLGTSCKFIAPSWKVIGPKTINISGVAGTPGAHGTSPGGHGQPGAPGGNGGNFYGKFFSQSGLDNLTVISNGGVGGRGGNGGNGTPGTDGLTTVSSSSHYDGGVHYTFNTHYTVRTLGTTRYYNNDGTGGTPGGNAGRGGFGGRPGTIQIDGHLWDGSVVNDGQMGENGTPGLGGAHGRHHRGHRIEGRYNQGYHKGNVKPGDTGSTAGGPIQEIIPLHYVDRGSASNGGLSSVEPQPPSAVIPLDEATLRTEYVTSWNQMSQDANVTPFMEVFPDLD